MQETAVLYASPAGGAQALCTRTEPCALTRAVSLADPSRYAVKMLVGSYTADLVVNKPLTVHGHGATLNTTPGARTIEFGKGADVHLFGLNIMNINTNGIALSCQPGQGNPIPLIALEDIAIDAIDTTLLLQGCAATITRSRLQTRTTTDRTIVVLPTSTLTIDQSILDGGDGVFVEGTNSVAHITNSIIKNQLGPEGAFVGSNLFGAGAGTVFVQFSTVINSRVRCAGATPACAGGTAAGSCIANSIIFNGTAGAPADTVEPGCVANYTLVFPQSTPLGSNNLYGVNPMFKDLAGADYHLAPGSPAIDAADPAATTLIDYDGTVRPQGTRSDIGAFESKPQ